MAEPILSRVSRLLSGTVEDVVDRMEQNGSDLVMREAVREVDRAVDQVKLQMERAMAHRLQAVRQQKMLAGHLEQLTEKAKLALREGREDLAEAALARQIDFEAQAEKLDHTAAEAREGEERLGDCLVSLQERKRQMEETLSAFMQSRREASLGGDGPRRNERGVEKQVERAEQAFDRAMTGAGGVGFARADAETLNRVAEIDGIRRRTAIAERLAALKNVMEAS